MQFVSRARDLGHACLKSTATFGFVVTIATAIFAFGVVRSTRTVQADDWQPISPDELKMTSVPEAPGAPAVILYRQVDRDDNAKTGNEQDYVRIKILTEEGRKFADVEIPYFREQGNIISLRARTIRPDGSIAMFDGKAYDKTIVKARNVKYLAKTFTLPDVQVGSIIEYRYTEDMSENYVYNSNWILSNELFTKLARFSLRPNKDFALRWSWPVGLPVGTQPPKQEPASRLVKMEASNIPAFQIEDYMPPANELKFRVLFEYSESMSESDPVKFWKERGKKLNAQVESFLGKKKDLEQAAAQMVSASDAPEVKAQKIYARVQQLKNTSFAVEKTDQEQKREQAKAIKTAADLLHAGGGDGRDITWVYLGLLRGAGIEAYPVWVSSRAEYFFNAKAMNLSELNANVVLVKLNGKDVYCDPGTAFAPFGLLPWGETGAAGLKLDKDGGSFVTTTLPESADSVIERKADLKMSEDGTLSGKVTMTFSGLEALRRRIEERNGDEAERKEYMEDQLKESVPVGIEAELTNKPDWSSSSPTLVAEFTFKAPGWATAAGHRALVPVGLFTATEKQLFTHSDRVHPIYFQFPNQRKDDVRIELPLSWKVTTVPPSKLQDAKAIVYDLKITNENGALHMTRLLKNDLLVIEQKQYPSLRGFFQIVRTGDEQAIVVQPGMASASTSTK
jgi:transglutaminase-like putative cysteine protease